MTWIITSLEPHKYPRRQGLTYHSLPPVLADEMLLDIVTLIGLHIIYDFFSAAMVEFSGFLMVLAATMWPVKPI